MSISGVGNEPAPVTANGKALSTSQVDKETSIMDVSPEIVRRTFSEPAVVSMEGDAVNSSARGDAIPLSIVSTADGEESTGGDYLEVAPGSTRLRRSSNASEDEGGKSNRHSGSASPGREKTIGADMSADRTRRSLSQALDALQEEQNGSIVLGSPRRESDIEKNGSTCRKDGNHSDIEMGVASAHEDAVDPFHPTSQLVNSLEENFDPLITYVGPTRQVVQYKSVSELPNDIRTKGPYWLDFLAITEADMAIIEEMFHLHPLTCEDVLSTDDIEGREKVEYFVDHDYLFVNVGTINENFGRDYLDIVSIYVIIFENCILSFHSSPTDVVSNVIGRLEKTSIRRQHYFSTCWILYLIMDISTDLFGTVVAGAIGGVESIDDLSGLVSVRDSAQDVLLRIGSARARLAKLRRVLIPKKEVVATIVTKDLPNISVNSRVYFRDVLDHLVRMLEKVEGGREMLSFSHSNYLAQLSLEVAEASNRINVVMKKFSAVATIMLPLSLVAGMFGMNVYVPGQSDPGPWWFLAICILMGIIAAILICCLRRHKML